MWWNLPLRSRDGAGGVDREEKVCMQNMGERIKAAMASYATTPEMTHSGFCTVKHPTGIKPPQVKTDYP